MLEHDRDLFRHALEAALRARGAEIVWAEDVHVQPGAAHAEALRVIVFDEGSIDPSEASPTRVKDRSKSMAGYVGMPATHAQREHYHAGMSYFRSGRRIGDELWIGAQVNTDFSDLVPPEAFAPGQCASEKSAAIS